MGAWGTGNFENDDAGDWIWELEKSKDKTLIRETLSRVANDDYPESPACSEALAAAEVVLAGLSGNDSGLPDEARQWLAKKVGWIIKRSRRFDAMDARLASSAVEQVLAKSELAELWEETEDGDPWRTAQKQLAQRLQSHS